MEVKNLKTSFCKEHSNLTIRELIDLHIANQEKVKITKVANEEVVNEV